jgi:integrase
MTALFNVNEITRSQATEISYVVRYQQLRTRFIKETGNTDMTPEEVVGHLLSKKEDLTMSYWRLLKNAVLYTMNTRFSHYNAAIEALQAESSAGLAKTSSRTSGRKMKHVPKGAWGKLQIVLQGRAKSGHKHSQGVLDVLCATLLTGLRPNEWCFSEIAIHGETGRELLRVRNSKHSNGRANGEFREIFIDNLTQDERSLIARSLSYCSRTNNSDAAKIQLALKNEFENARDRTLPSLKRAASSITLYSFRHQFIANAKTTFESPAIIAALCGHSSTKTASMHYGKRRHGNAKIKVTPTVESIAQVHRVAVEAYKVTTMKMERSSGPTI